MIKQNARTDAQDLKMKRLLRSGEKNNQMAQNGKRGLKK